MVDYKVQSYGIWGEYAEIHLEKGNGIDEKTYLFQNEECIHAFEQSGPIYAWNKIDMCKEEKSSLWSRFRLQLPFLESHQKVDHLWDYHEYILIKKGIEENSVFRITDDEEGCGFIFLEETDVTRGFAVLEGNIDLFIDIFDPPYPCPLRIKRYLESKGIPFTIHFNEEQYED